MDDYVRVVKAKVSMHEFLDENDVAILLVAEDGKHLPCRMTRVDWDNFSQWGTTDQDLVERLKDAAKWAEVTD